MRPEGTSTVLRKLLMTVSCAETLVAWIRRGSSIRGFAGLERDPVQILEVRARVRKVAGRVIRGFLLDVTRLLIQRRDRGEKLLEIEHPLPEARVARTIGLRVLEMEAPEA